MKHFDLSEQCTSGGDYSHHGDFIHDFDSVLFDFDGTMAPCLDLADLKRRVLEFTVDNGIPAAELEGHFIVEMVEYAAARLARETPDTAIDYRRRAHALIKSREVAQAKDYRLYPGVRRLLRKLRAHRKSLGVVTRNCDEAVSIMFPDAANYVDLMLTRDRVTHLKPDPRHLTQALDEFGCRHSAGLMVGDGAMDMSAGKGLGMTCIGVLSGNTPRRILQDAGADVILDNVVDLLAWL